jgi:cyclopropane-fatty-acyl-phospholipid synthase
MLPSIKQISEASEDIFVLEDWHNFGVDYDKTLMAWHENFEASWDSIEGDYDERFKRMWDYYLLSFAGSFRARKNQLWQIVFSKDGVKGGYESLR